MDEPKEKLQDIARTMGVGGYKRHVLLCLGPDCCAPEVGQAAWDVLKRELKDRNLWVAAYANDVFAYVPSARILIEGGYEADFNMIYYGLPTRFSNDVEDVLIKKVHELVKKVGS